MSEPTRAIPVLSTWQDVQLAVERYRTSDLSGTELLSLWQAIRDASLNQDFSQPESDGVGGEHSY